MKYDFLLVRGIFGKSGKSGSRENFPFSHRTSCVHVGGRERVCLFFPKLAAPRMFSLDSRDFAWSARQWYSTLWHIRTSKIQFDFYIYTRALQALARPFLLCNFI